MIRILLLLSTLLFIQGCSVLTSTKPNIPKESQSTSANPIRTTKPFEPETLYSLLAAEIAGGRQQYKVTLANYIQQARKTQDIGVIARATRIAQFLGAHRQALALGLLWTCTPAAHPAAPPPNTHPVDPLKTASNV